MGIRPAGDTVTILETLLAPLQDRRILDIGCGRGKLLQALAERGAQVLDLEAFAHHRGSVLGGWPGVAQPSQTAFETALVQALEPFDLERPIYVEGESARIGRIALPLPLVAQMRDARAIEIAATPEARLEYLLRDYAYLGDDSEALAGKLAILTESRGKETVGRWQAWAHEGNLAPLFSELMSSHYDPHYERSQSNHFRDWANRQRIEATALAPADIDRVAQQILDLEQQKPS